MPSREVVAALGPALVCMSLGCGLGLVEGTSGGGEHLPTQGTGPYGKLGIDVETPADEPYVIAVFRVNVRDPSALWRDDGGVRLWFGYEEDLSGEESAIAYAELPDITELPDVGPHPVLVADAPWEQGFVGAPSVLELDDGALVMFYQGGRDAPGIGRADSHDRGATWVKHADNPLVPLAAQPGVARLPPGDPLGSWLLCFTRPDQPGIFQAHSDDGVVWSAGEPPVLLPRPEVEGAWDRHAVTSPMPVVRTTAAGRVHHGMFYEGIDRSGQRPVASIGWAGSFDGLHWRRFDSPDEPVLAPGGASEHAPSVLLQSDRGILFFHELRQGVQSIAVAVHP